MEKHITKAWVIKAIVWAIVGCIVAVCTWLAWIYDLPAKFKRWFLRRVNRN